MGVNSEAMLDAKLIDLIKLLHIYLAHFPKFEKFSLCAQIRDTAYELYGLIASAQKKFHKKTLLFQADVVHEKLRMLIRLAFELGYLSYHDKRKANIPNDQQGLNRLINLQTLIDEVGRQLGGWISFVKEQKG